MENVERIQAPPEIERILTKLVRVNEKSSRGKAKAMILGGVTADGEFTTDNSHFEIVSGKSGKQYSFNLTQKSIEEAIDPNPEVQDARLLSEAEDPFNYDSDQCVQPPWSYSTLNDLLVENTWHSACVETKASDCAYSKPLLFLRPGAKDLASEDDLARAKEEIFSFLRTCYEGRSIEDLLKDVAVEYEALGCASFEIRRDSTGRIGALTLVPFADVRFLNKKFSDATGAKYLQKKYGTKVYYTGFNDLMYFTDKDGNHFQPSIAPDSVFPSYDKREGHMSFTPTFVDYRNAEDTHDRDNAANELFVLARSPFTRSRLYGTPSGISAYSAMLAQMKIDSYNLAYFTAQGIPQYAVIFKNLSETRDSSVHDIIPREDDEVDAMTEAEIAQLRETIKQYFKKELATGNRSILVLTLTGNAEVVFEKLSNEKIEASFELYEKRCRDKIRVAHRVPPSAMGIDVSNSGIGSTRDLAQLKRYRDHIVAPGQRLYESIVNLIIRCGLLIPYFDFKLAPMSLEEESSERQTLMDEVRNGLITINEYREARGWSKIDDPTADSLIIRSTNITMLNTDPDASAQRLQDSIGYEKSLRKMLAGDVLLDKLDKLDSPDEDPLKEFGNV